MTIKLWVCCGTALLVASCASVTPLKPAATRVVTTTASPPASCHFLKTLAVEASKGVDFAYRSHQTIQADQLNQLKNSTANLGGNLFVLTDHQTTYQNMQLKNVDIITERDTVVAITPATSVYLHAMRGDAYLCDAAALVSVKVAPRATVRIDAAVSGK